MNRPEPEQPPASKKHEADDSPEGGNEVCPVCGAPLIQEKCKVVCRSSRCLYRIIYNCAEF